ncbi:hypothetical protein RJ639_016964 [Escallonia herrerae]|uniref:Uncharacterized protein n=1 Tax=Escallonia herrerae TaxID=1293975 RepID=A0AA88VBD1_9ASTE|nr:hypothetical protein RJ639_016964 [Escallonia herrerae]
MTLGGLSADLEQVVDPPLSIDPTLWTNAAGPGPLFSTTNFNINKILLGLSAVGRHLLLSPKPLLNPITELASPGPPPNISSTPWQESTDIMFPQAPTGTNDNPWLSGTQFLAPDYESDDDNIMEGHAGSPANSHQMKRSYENDVLSGDSPKEKKHRASTLAPPSPSPGSAFDPLPILLGIGQFYCKTFGFLFSLEDITMATSKTIPESGLVHPSGGTVYATPYVAPAHGSVGLGERPEKFNGKDFKRWQHKMLFYLTTLNFTRFLQEDAPDLGENPDLQTVAAKRVQKQAPALSDSLNLTIFVEPFLVLLEALQMFCGYEPYPGFHASVRAKMVAETKGWQDKEHKKVKFKIQSKALPKSEPTLRLGRVPKLMCNTGLSLDNPLLNSHFTGCIHQA